MQGLFRAKARDATWPVLHNKRHVVYYCTCGDATMLVSAMFALHEDGVPRYSC